MTRRFQFSLRALLVVVTVFGVVLGWAVDRANRQRMAVRELHAPERFRYVDMVVDGEPRGAYNIQAYSMILVVYERRWPGWFEGLFGRDFLNDVVALEVAGLGCNDDDITHMAELPGLRRLHVAAETFTPSALTQLRKAKPELTVDFGIVVERE